MTASKKLNDLQLESVEVAQHGMNYAVDLPSNLPSDHDEFKALEKKLVRKIDWRLMPVLTIMIVLKYVPISCLFLQCIATNLEQVILTVMRFRMHESKVSRKTSDLWVKISILLYPCYLPDISPYKSRRI